MILGSARDIVEHCGVPRFLFTDFPLGNPCGKPWDLEMQRRIVGHAFDLLESAVASRTTVQTPFLWSEDSSWRERYARIDPSKAEKAARKQQQIAEKAAKKAEQAAAKAKAKSAVVTPKGKAASPKRTAKKKSRGTASGSGDTVPA